LRNLLREARERKGLSQRELAKRVGVTKAAISHFETGRATPTLATFARLARVLGLDLAVLLELGRNGGEAPEEKAAAGVEAPAREGKGR